MTNDEKFIALLTSNDKKKIEEQSENKNSKL